jgi:hypothetical protein
MKSVIWTLLLAGCTVIGSAADQYLNKDERNVKKNYTDCYDTGSDNIYEYGFETIDGQTNVSLSSYRNYTLLVVNVATY